MGKPLRAIKDACFPAPSHIRWAFAYSSQRSSGEPEPQDLALAMRLLIAR